MSWQWPWQYSSVDIFDMRLNLQIIHMLKYAVQKLGPCGNSNVIQLNW